MLEVKGFKGLRFDPAQTEGLDYVVTPPYDVITPEERANLVQRSPYSMARVILPEEKDGLDRYQAAAREFESWIAQDILRQDTEDTFYLLQQTFTEPDGSIAIRRGFLGVARLPEPNERIVLGHEHTFSGVVDDRFYLTESTRANLGPVFVTYDDRNGELDWFFAPMHERPEDYAARTIDGVLQQIWRTPHDPRVTTFFQGKLLYIADGHHRFRTACLYRDKMREQEKPDSLREYDYVLMGFVPLSDPGLRIYPTHRLLPTPEGFDANQFLTAAAEWFEVEHIEANLAARVAADPGCVFGVIIHGHGEYLLQLKDIDRVAFLGDDCAAAWRDLDVAVLHRGLIGRILGVDDQKATFGYERDDAKVIDAVHRGDYGLGFLLKGTRADQIRACAEVGANMPHKSTYFFPKLPTGAVIHRLV